MPTINDTVLSDLLLKDADPKLIEPHIYSLFQDTKPANSYDNKFGNIYDWVACNPLYNRLIWGYSTGKFSSLVNHAMMSSENGYILDVGCGSLAFTAKTYLKHRNRRVVFSDQSLKLLRIAKSRLANADNSIPENMIFFQNDAMQLPFEPDTFNTIICLNLLHVIDDIKTVITGLKNILTKDGKIYFTTLVRNNRLADRYLKLWEDKDEVISRDIEQLTAVFNELEMPVTYSIDGNMAFISHKA